MNRAWMAGLVALAACSQAVVESPAPRPQPTSRLVDGPPRVYQLLVRTFGNDKGVNRYDGDLATNGSGTFEDLNDAALDSLSALGVTHLWLTGVPRQATLTDFSAIDPRLTPDDPDIVKGRAGSPFAVRDAFDVSPELAKDPAHRVDSFMAAVARIHAHGLKVVIDLVPNHVARSYASVVKPEFDFGRNDDPARFFAPGNDLFHLPEPAGEALRLSYPAGAPPRSGLDGRFGPEDASTPARTPRATGNNQTSHSPSADDWYEVVKLNHGFDFVTRTGHYDPQPASWAKLDAVLAHWQSLGVDGFRFDFAHWVPVELWRWLLPRAKARRPAFLFAEVYDNPDAVPGYSREALVAAGFDALYDAKAYETAKGIFAGPNWANDLDGIRPAKALAGHALRYAENHDERRAASRVVAGSGHGSGFGSGEAGFAVTALLQLQSTEPVLLHAGQEVAEPGAGVEGFGGEDGRTSIFDYWSPPEFSKWVNGHRYDGALLSPAQQALRANYARLLGLLKEPAFARGSWSALSEVNKAQRAFGEGGHFVHAFVRDDDATKSAFVVLANLDPTRAFSPKLVLPQALLGRLGRGTGGAAVVLRDRFSPLTWSGTAAEWGAGVEVELPPLGVRVLELDP